MPIKNLTDSNKLLAQTLHDLIKSNDKLSPASLARALSIPTNKITRILNGDVTDPKASTLLQIAHYFGVSINQLLGIDTLQSSNIESHSQTSQLLPVFNLNHRSNSDKPKEWYKWVENDTEGDCYALCIDTDFYEPTFPQNSLLIVHSDLLPDDRCFVIVKNKNNLSHCSIKRFVVDGSETYLYPTNPKLSVEFYDEYVHVITGVVLEVHQKLRTKNKLP